MVLDLLNGQMVESRGGNGEMENSMAEDFIQAQKELRKKENGEMGKKSDGFSFL